MNNIQQVSKAIAAFLAGAVVAYLAKRGIVIEPQYSDALSVLLGGLITAAVVYLSPKNK